MTMDHLDYTLQPTIISNILCLLMLVVEGHHHSHAKYSNGIKGHVSFLGQVEDTLYG